MKAAEELQSRGAAVNVLNLTSSRGLFETWQRLQWEQKPGPFDWLIPPNERHAPIITVQDGGIAHALVAGQRLRKQLSCPWEWMNLGSRVPRRILYEHFGIDAEGIVEAGLVALNRGGFVYAILKGSS